MEFGKLAHIDDVDWSLPPDVDSSLQYLKNLPASSATKYYIGTPAWGHKEWAGKIYPVKAKASEYLRYYAQSFNSIELNTSHYRIPHQEQTLKWCEQVQASADFVFCPKIFNGISHESNGLLDKTLIKEWLKFLENLKERRGPCFMQLPPHFDYSRKALLFHFLQAWPTEFELSIEFRHESWFENHRVLPALEKYLQGKNIGLVITDVAGRRDLLHTSITSPFVLLRFIGNDLHPTDFTRSRAWAERLNRWSQHGLNKVFFFAHEPDDLKAPEIAQSIIRDLNEEGGADLLPLQWQTTPNTQS